MSGRYEQFTIADPLFYDELGPRTESLGFGVARREPPEGWQRHDDGEWIQLQPPNTTSPRQGWKIHASATTDNADRVLEATWDYCVHHGIPFKFLRGRHTLQLRNAKYADRGASGKAVTIYPADESWLKTVLTELGEALRGEPGPYILSDLRWQDGPLHVRYGGFVRRLCTSPSGELVPAIEDPEGHLVPDQREPVFRPPEWVTLPSFLHPARDARDGSTVSDLPYRIRKVLHFSNGGGLYLAEDTRDGARVVLKEARPHAGLSSDGADAVTRLLREGEMLGRLAGIEGLPAVRDRFVLDEHEFLVVDYVEGEPLNRVYGQEYPLRKVKASKREMADYTRWALDVHRQVSRIISEIHARDIVYGDLHLRNVVIRPDGRVALVDFEVASGLDEKRRPALGNPAFAAPGDRHGFDIDRYALACLGLALFLPITSVLRLDTRKASELAEAITEHFTVPRSFLDQQVRTIERRGEQPPRSTEPATRPARLRAHADGWRQARASLTAGIVASATPDREDRLFPGDIDQFSTGGLNIAYGAAGVLYALSVTDCGRYPSFEEWLTLRALRPATGARLGFFDGLHGVAHVLDHLGHHEHAMEVLDLCRREQWSMLNNDLFSGLAGVGLNLLHFAERTGDRALRSEAMRVVDLVAERLGAVDDVPTTSGGKNPHAGLMDGSSGPALLFVRAYEHTGETRLLDLAAVALRQDLRRCVIRDGTTMHVDEGWRTLPYLDRGSVGIGAVLDEYLLQRNDEGLQQARRAIDCAARSPFYIQSGLFRGRAGIIAYLARRHPAGRAAENDADIAAHVDRLNWHALSYQGHLAFPGERLLRLSMDLATGAAGVLLALGTALHDQPVTLPHLHVGRPPEITVPQQATVGPETTVAQETVGEIKVPQQETGRTAQRRPQQGAAPEHRAAPETGTTPTSGERG